MLKTTKNWLLLEDKDEAPHVWGPWITIKKTASLVLNTLHHFQLHPHQDLASHEGGEILLEEHGQMFFKRGCIVLLADTVDAYIGSCTYTISEASTKHVSITVYAESPIYHWQPHWGMFEDINESLPFTSGSSPPSYYSN